MQTSLKNGLQIGHQSDIMDVDIRHPTTTNTSDHQILVLSTTSHPRLQYDHAKMQVQNMTMMNNKA